jgi:hypothetical protein
VDQPDAAGRHHALGVRGRGDHTPSAADQGCALTRILLDQGLFVCALVFAAEFRLLVRAAREDYEWIATLLFGAAAVWLAVTLVADALIGGAVLGSLSSRPDPSAVRVLEVGTTLIYNSSTAFVLTGLFLAVASVATIGTCVVPA